MDYEVEQKHRVGDGWDAAVHLAAFGAHLGKPIEQADEYFAHPCRDFAQTDEALRVRIEGGRGFVTYKGPKVDKKTKTRRELELPLDRADRDGKRFAELLRAIGFSPVAVVRKTRRPFQIHYGGRDVDGSYDLVDGVGAFIELELTSDDAGLEDAKRVIGEIAEKLELGPSTRRSYLEMVLETRPQDGN